MPVVLRALLSLEQIDVYNCGSSPVIPFQLDQKVLLAVACLQRIYQCYQCAEVLSQLSRAAIKKWDMYDLSLLHATVKCSV